MQSGMQMITDALPDLLRRLAAVAQRDVLVGVPAGEGRDDGQTRHD